ncbi:MAG: hypothetical protein HY548_02155 [Elusimicrobia bacterium]|nr:hypothetical protein [Elusimicrobiota bacterium]
MPNEDALKDGNRVPTLLFAENNETRRVTNLKPLPVSGLLPDDVAMKTETLELSGTAQQTFITPAAGKRLVVKGVSITPSPASGYEAQVKFTGGKVIRKVYRADEAGVLVPMKIKGAVNETLIAETLSFPVAQKCFFTVNYLEE